MAWLSVPGLAGLNSESDWPSLPLGPFVSLSGTPTQRAFSWRGWKTRPWIRLLSGMTFSPSTAQSGVGRWISSLPDSRASRGAAPGSGRGATTSGGSGRGSLGSFGTYPPGSSSLRTSPGLFPEEDSSPSSVTWPRSGSMRSGRLFVRPRLGLRTSGSGCSSWPTATVTSGAQTAENPTPGQTGGTTLDGRRRTRPARRTGKHGEPGAGERHPTILSTWATPTARDHKDGACDIEKNPVNGLLGRQVLTATGPGCRSGSGRRWATPKANEMPTGVNAQGGESLTTQVGNKRRLNPNFVDWLMGWPPGWTDANGAPRSLIGGMGSECAPRSHGTEGNGSSDSPTRCEAARTGSGAEGMASWLSRQRALLRCLLDG